MNCIDLMFEIFPILETGRFILRQVKEGLRKESVYNMATDGYEDRLIFGIVNN